LCAQIQLSTLIVPEQGRDEEEKVAAGVGAGTFQTFYDAMAELSGGRTVVVEEGGGLVRYSRLMAALQQVAASSQPAVPLRQLILHR
jgi:hypothetical protein